MPEFIKILTFGTHAIILVASTTLHVMRSGDSMPVLSPRPASILNFSLREFQQFHPFNIIHSFAHRNGWPWPMCPHGQTGRAGGALWRFVDFSCSRFVFSQIVVRLVINGILLYVGKSMYSCRYYYQSEQWFMLTAEQNSRWTMKEDIL